VSYHPAPCIGPIERKAPMRRILFSLPMIALLFTFAVVAGCECCD
jgi:hypothetical protein